MTSPYHSYADLARQSIIYYLDQGQVMPCPDSLNGELKKKRGTFVCLKKGKQLRGCVGTIVPVRENLAQEIIQNSVNAATEDPRFSPVGKEEIPQLSFSVDVLSPLEKVQTKSDLDTKRFGLVVRGKSSQGVLLPDIEGVNSVDDQIKICKRKAGLENDEDLEYFRFSVQRYKSQL